jgi:hypothetical protein
MDHEFARYIRTHHSRELVDFMIRVLRGEPLSGATGDNGAPTAADRQRAARGSPPTRRCG